MRIDLQSLWNKIMEYEFMPDGVDLINPPGFLEFLQLKSSAKLVLTDSGGVQEETCISGIPCVTLKGADNILVINKGLKDYAVEMDGDINKISVIPAGVDIDTFNPRWMALQ